MKNKKLLAPNLLISDMLKKKTLAQLLEDGDLYTAEDAAPLMGIHHMSVTRLCRTGRIESAEQNGRWYLYARTVHGFIKHRPQRAA
jgi:hypothetical protein